MSEIATYEYLMMIPYPIREITVSQTFRDIYWRPNPGFVDLAEDDYRVDPDHESDISVAADGSLLTGLESLEGARRAGLDRVRVDLHDHTTTELLHKKIRMIDFARNDPFTTPMTVTRCMVLFDQLLRDPACPRILDVPQADPADMIAWHLHCPREDALRYLQVLQAPRAVQDALDCGMIELSLAEQVCMLPQLAQDGIAGMILPLLDMNHGKTAQAHMINQYVQSLLDGDKPKREHLVVATTQSEPVQR